MSTRRFTLAEANELIGEIRPLLKELVTRQEAIAKKSEAAIGPLPQAYMNVGNPAASRLSREFAAVESLVAKITATGCQLKDIRLGLVDFLTELDGREVNLCWRFDEEQISYYHELDEGYSNRRPLPDA